MNRYPCNHYKSFRFIAQERASSGKIIQCKIPVLWKWIHKIYLSHLKSMWTLGLFHRNFIFNGITLTHFQFKCIGDILHTTVPVAPTSPFLWAAPSIVVCRRCHTTTLNPFLNVTKTKLQKGLCFKSCPYSNSHSHKCLWVVSDLYLHL